MNTRSWIGIGLIWTSYALADTPNLQPLDSLQAAAKAFAEETFQQTLPGEKITVTALPVDTRLKLPACPIPLETFTYSPLQPAKQITIGIRCTHPGSIWSTYLPVSMTWLKPVLFSTQLLVHGTQPDPNQLTLQEIDVIPWLRQGFFESTAAVAGLVPTYDVPTNQPLLRSRFKPNLLIKRGQLVQLLSGQDQNFEVRMSGTSLDNGSLGQRIRAQNTTSKRLVEGIVVDQQTIRIDS